MTSPKRAYLDKNGDRLYIGVNPKTRNKSVTTFMKVLPKPWLAPWVAKVTAEAAGSIIEHLFYDALAQNDLSDRLFPYIDDDDGNLELDCDLLVDDLKKIHEGIRDDAGDLGDNVHELIELLISTSKGNAKVYKAMWLDVADSYEPEVWNRAGLVVPFLESHDVQVVAVEPTLYNDTLGYAGSADLLVRVDGVLLILDIKTSRNWSDAFAIQVSAYANAEYYMLDNFDKQTFPMPEVEGGGVLWVEPDRCRMIEVDISEDTFNVFKACQTLTDKWITLPKSKTTIFDSKELNDRGEGAAA